MKRYIFTLLHPINTFRRFRLKRLIKRGNFANDEDYIKKVFKIRVGYRLDLSNPITFNEKLNWMKLYDKNPKYTLLADKCEAKRFVKETLGEKYVAKEYGVYSSFNEINFDELPNSFVLKTTHGSGGVVVCKDKNKVDWQAISTKINSSLKDNYFYHSREWPYKNIVPRILVEEFLTDECHSVLPVYKFFCFNGEPFLLQAIQNDKCVNESIDYYDMNWNNLHIRQNLPNSKSELNKPSCFEEMIMVCKTLSSGFSFIRIDLYDIKGKTYFSEFTFYSDGGLERFHPKKWDKILGDKIELKQKGIK